MQSELDRARELHRGGAIDEAKRIYEAVLEAEPANAEALHLLGVTRLQSNDAAQAVALIGRAIEIDGADARFHNNLGEAHRSLGDLPNALESYRTARGLDPEFAQAINNEGAALMAAGQVQEAAACFSDAIAADQSYLQAHLNLGLALHSAGDLRGAMEALAAARALDPSNLTLLQSYAMVAGRARSEALDERCKPHIADALAADGIDAQRLVRPALRLLSQSPEFSALGEATDAAILEGQHDQVLDNQILLGLLRRTVVTSTGAETLLTRLRRLCLFGLSREDGGIAGRSPGFANALATQCFLTDYAYAQTPLESERVALLIERVRGGSSGDGESSTSVIGMYESLGAVSQADDLGTPVADELFALQIAAGRKEAEFAAAVPSLTPTHGNASESSPYPRWVSCDRRLAVPFAHVLGALFTDYPTPDFAHRPVRTLIAGCGTGKHAIEVARQYLISEMIAIDGNRANLGYAARMAAELEIFNIKFMHADIAALGDWTERFQVIESSGVLHHLDDPLAGWRVLVDKLEPGGFMKVGLYSRLARQKIADTRAMVAAGPNLATAALMLEARQAIIELPRDDQRRGVTDHVDFYSLRGCDDLLLGTREHSFTLPDIASMLGTLSLTFIGFQFGDPGVPARYADRYPEAAPNDIDQWRIFEQAYPETFAGMYQFWCRKDS